MEKGTENVVYLFVGKVIDFADCNRLPLYTRQEIAHTTNAVAIDQKRASYGLLDQALELLEIEADFARFTKVNGKPIAPDFCFSYSHSNDLVFLAIAAGDVGADIERVDQQRNFSKLKNYICAANEKVENIDELTKLWTQKEAAFKFLGEKQFLPKQIIVDHFNCQSLQIDLGEEKYYASVCTNKKSVIKFFNLIDLDCNELVLN